MISDEQRIIKALHANLDEQIRLQRELTAAIAGDIMAYNINNAAKAMGVSRQTINRLVKAGKLRQVEGLIPRSSIMELLDTTPRLRRKANAK
jgi:predicted DNA-binding protein (UPF0251 family)